MIDSSELDLQLAIQLQEKFEEELRQQKANSLRTETEQAAKKDVAVLGQSEAQLSVSLVDPVWELVDPVPDVHALFCTYNDQFFWGKLLSVSVSWSPRMTLCAGVCCYERRGGLCSIRLSVPLLKLRPRSDLVETLLHEMIHAYLFVTANNRDRDGHGPEFLKHMHRINVKARTKISVYHSFHDEVAVYKQHVWQCSGPCQKWRPYYGLVKRSMNRVPGPNDRWWREHQRTCGGTYTKIKEPEGFSAKGVKRKVALPHNGAGAKRKASAVPTQDIRNYFTGSPKSLSATTGSVSKPPAGGSNLAVTNVARPVTDVARPVTKQPSGSAVSNSNIRGFGSTSSGAVKAVEVGNASRSKIVGFNKGLNKSHSNSAKNNQSGSNPSWKKGSGGGGLALGSGGTLVLNPKAKPKSATTEVGSEVSDNGGGKGHLLDDKITEPRVQVAASSAGENGGRPQRHVSRLLAEYDATVALRNSNRPQSARAGTRTDNDRPSTSCPDRRSSSHLSSLYTGPSSSARQPGLHPNCSTGGTVTPREAVVQNSLSDSDSDDDINGVKICPLCEHSICSNEFLTHISICMGGWSEDLGLENDDLPLLSALRDLNASKNGGASGSNSSECEDSNMIAEENPPREVAVASVTHRANQSESQKNANLLKNAASKDKHREKIPKKQTQNDELFISVSDSDEDFDEKYWHKPVVSVVQLAQGIKKLGVGDVSGKVALSSQFQTATSASEGGNVVTNHDGTADAAPKFPCPVCGELYTEDYITSVHMNTHFD